MNTKQILIAAALLLLPLTAMAGQPVGKAIRDDIAGAMASEKQVQEMKTDWAEASKEFSDRLDRLNREARTLAKRVEKADARLALEEARQKENFRRQKEAARVRAEIGTFLDTVIDRLAAAVDSDLPFLAQERRGRLSELKQMTVNPDLSSAERFRRVFEALQIEAEYGTTVEVTQETLAFGGDKVLADVFRLGRIALFCQTMDHHRSGIFDSGSKAWKPLPEETNRDISKAIAMARLERTVELVKLPLGRIVVQ